MILTIFLEKKAARCVCPHNCYFLSVSHTIFALTQKLLERMKLPGQKKQKNIVMTQAGKILKLSLVLDIHQATDIKASKLLEVLCLGILGRLWDRFYGQTAVTFTSDHFECSQARKRFSE